MPSHEPPMLHEQFESAYNAGDIERLMALYEPECALVGAPGSVALGADQVRAGLEGLLALKGQACLTTREVVQVGDLALLSCSWTLEGTGPDGQPLTIGGVTAEVARRQSDGRWLYVIDNAVADQTNKA
ncbi:MAG TPA: DUF4440 domain-containing protein [Thermomicrobiales bacterium]|nr:DUF4440 domain-containing protein [Thermomicrobiales bacterium]